ncbi:hypothetical protein K440DRAFT_641458 [Wilcoxina mikolae CBS 423.85]|nr:hypothetical protein K440DRAFT_641458 [Wilcoxina mikolae CBS 423.85]
MCAPEVKEIIEDTAFWVALEDLDTLIDEISKRQKSAEIGYAHIGKVRRRWDDIRLHIERCLQSTTFRSTPDAAAQFLPIFDRRRKQQSTELHTVAYLLDPVNSESDGLDDHNTVDEFFAEDGDSAGHARRQYAEFRSREGFFSNYNRS